eukprot:5392864-Amphidinium_carterae.1
MLMSAVAFRPTQAVIRSAAAQEYRTRINFPAVRLRSTPTGRFRLDLICYHVAFMVYRHSWNAVSREN